MLPVDEAELQRWLRARARGFPYFTLVLFLGTGVALVLCARGVLSGGWSRPLAALNLFWGGMMTARLLDWLTERFAARWLGWLARCLGKDWGRR